VLALGKSFIPIIQVAIIINKPLTPVLHPYYKLAYIKMAWGGPEEQAAGISAGNVDAKDWQDEARQIIENTVCSTFSLLSCIGCAHYK
jgi:hypothetical protein